MRGSTDADFAVFGTYAPPARTRLNALFPTLMSFTVVNDNACVPAFIVPTPISVALRLATTEEASRFPPMNFFCFQTAFVGTGA